MDDRPRRHERAGTARRRRIVGALPAALIATLPLLVAGCSVEQSVCSGQEPDPPLDTFAGPDARGNTVSICSEVDELLSPSSFVFATPDGASLLVVSALETPDIDEGDQLRVTGVVRRFRYDAYAEEFELGQRRRYAPFAGEPVLVAKSVNENHSPE